MDELNCEPATILPKRICVELTLARLLTNLSDESVQSPNVTLARHALGSAVNAAAETMMLLYFLEEPCIKALVMASARLPVQERRRILHELAASRMVESGG